MLFLGVVGNLVGGPADGPVVKAEAVDGVPAQVTGEKGLLQGVQPTGDVVFPVELVLGEHPQEDVLGQDVLQQHLPNVAGGHGGADGLLA